MVVFIASIVIFGASLVQGATSFGFSLIALPLLGIFYPLKVIVPALVTLSLLLNLVVLLRLKKMPHIRQLMLLTCVAIITIPLGVELLLFVDEVILKKAVGVLLILIAVMMLRGYTVPLKNKHVTYIVTGVLSGILNGSVSLSGPPVIVLMANEQQDKNQFRANLSFIFFILNIFTIMMYMKDGLYQSPDLQDLLKLFPVMIIGTFVGIYLGNVIGDSKFKKIVLYLLIIMGIMNLV